MLIAVSGATGTGKTALSLDVAEALARRGSPAEIVNADAMQLYRGMDVGTAKLPAGERRGIPHHLLDLWDVRERASVAVYRDAARRAIEGVESRGAVPILVGGSGLYLRAVLRDLEMPGTDEAVRRRIEQEAADRGPAALHARLAAVEPRAAARIPAANVRRVVRALEAIEVSGRPFTATMPDEAPWWRPTLQVSTATPADELAARLDARARAMWSGGLLDEVEQLLAEGLADGPTAARAVGYAQAMRVLEGSMPVADGVEETIRLTWRVVRRQRSWFRRDTGALEVRADDPGAVARVVDALRVSGDRTTGGGRTADVPSRD